MSRSQANYHEIQKRWYLGETLKQIAEALGSTPNSVQVTIHRMRLQGWDVPRRNKGFM